MPNLWTHREHVTRYLAAADSIPHRAEGDAALLELIPPDAGRVLDLGTGDGRLLAVILESRTSASAVGLDFSETMLDAARGRFEATSHVEIVASDLESPLPDLGTFDTVVSSFAIHHVSDDRKQSLYREVFELLAPGGVFCNLDHVASPTERLHREFLDAIGTDPADDDPSNILAPVELQVAWLVELGFEDADCHWKWRELALMAGRRP